MNPSRMGNCLFGSKTIEEKEAQVPLMTNVVYVPVESEEIEVVPPICHQCQKPKQVQAIVSGDKKKRLFLCMNCKPR